MTRNTMTALGLLVGLAAFHWLRPARHATPQPAAVVAVPADTVAVSSPTESKARIFTAVEKPSSWPPAVNALYPDFALEGADGSRTTFRELAGGRIVLVEPIGMTCPACHAWSGSVEKGAFRNVAPQSDLPPIASSFQIFTGVPLTDSRVLLVQLLLYSSSMGPTSREDAVAWASHFDFGKGGDYVVIAAGPSFINDASYQMIPGFHLLSPEGKVLADSTGHAPRDGLGTVLLLTAKRLLQESVRLPAAAPTAASNVETLTGISVEEAYRRIPHHRTVFSDKDSTIPEDKARLLKEAFRLSDMATVLRVVGLEALLSQRQKPAYMDSSYEEILTGLSHLDSTGKDVFLQTLSEAVRDQRDIFRDWAKARAMNIVSLPKVRSSSSKLREAYSLLIAAYPGETPTNKQAYFDYLCALDFI